MEKTNENFEKDGEKTCFFCGNKVEYKTDVIEKWQNIKLTEPIVAGYYICNNCKEYYYTTKYSPKTISELNKCCRELRNET